MKKAFIAIASVFAVLASIGTFFISTKKRKDKK